MAEIEITDKRRFTTDGERTLEVVAEQSPVAVTDAEVSKFLQEAPRIYEDPIPLNDRVLIKQKDAETTYAGTTFIIPDVAQKNPNAGVVIAIGPEVDAIKDCGPGDLVIFNVYSAEEVVLESQRFVHCSKHDIHMRQRVTYAVASQH
jgi:co-chaperonin GroES (HSP10)